MKINIGVLLLNISVALYLAATGIMGLQQQGLRQKGEIRQAVEALLGRGDLTNVLVIVLSVVSLIAGLLIIARLFNAKIPMADLLLFILAIVWVAFIVMIDFIAPAKARGDTNFVQWALTFSSHLMVLAGIALSTDKLGGR